MCGYECVRTCVCVCVPVPMWTQLPYPAARPLQRMWQVLPIEEGFSTPQLWQSIPELSLAASLRNVLRTVLNQPTHVCRPLV